MKTIACFSCLLAISLLTGCFVSKPVSEMVPVNNQTYKVDYLFEHDGCKVYRFLDLGHFVYFTNCQGEMMSFPDSTTIIKNRTERQ